MALAAKDGIFDTHKIPIFVKLKVAVGTSDNENATQCLCYLQHYGFWFN